MYDMGMLHNKPFKKSARIVGEVLGKYHPHGDTAVYDTLVRMAQDFSLRYPLINGQGNFGSIDGDNAAAMRYTEAKLQRLAEELLQDIDKETVKFVPNFDGSLEEPSVLPSKAPELMINGSSGIAVGMATNIPPHNVKEVCTAVSQIIDNPEISVEYLMKTMPAPDFPTGGIICGTQGVKNAYKTGRGKITLRGKVSIEEGKKTKLIITEIPYQVNKSQLIEEIADLVRNKKIIGISDLRDESNKDGIRVVMELRSGANTDVLLNQLYSHTRLQTTFGVIQLALVDNQPKVLTLKQTINEFIKHRQSMVRKRTEYDLRQSEEKAHLLEGLIIALDNIDPVVALIKASKSGKEAKQGLIQDYKLSEKQAQAILEMRLQRLTGLEQDKIRADHKKLLELIAELKAILASEQKILDIIKKEMGELIEKYGDQRKTQILEIEATKFEEAELIKPEQMVVTITHAGYVKRIPLDTYKAQKRGGKGIKATETKGEDFVEHVFSANTHDYILFFSNKGKIHWLKVYQLPEASRYARGTAVVNLLALEKEETINAFIPVSKFEPNNFLMMVTKKGIIKKTSLAEFSNPRKGGIKAIGNPEDDELVTVVLTDGSKDVIIATEQGMAVRFNEKDVRPMGRTAYGVRGIKLKAEDKVVGMVVAEKNKTLLTVTAKGYGKRTQIEEYRLISRGGVGVTNIKITDKNGKVVTIRAVRDQDDLMLISQKGIIIRIPSKSISVIGRATQGVRVMKLDEGDRLVAAAKIVSEETEELNESTSPNQ